MSGAPAAAVKLRFGDGAHRFRLDVPISLPELRARAAEAFAAHDRLDHMTAPLSYTDGDGDRIEVISSEDLVLAMEDAAASGRTALTLDVGEAVTALGDHLLATATSALSAPSDDAPIAANNDGLHHTAVITAYHVDSSPGSDLVKPPVDAAEAAEPRAKSSQTRTCSTEVDRQLGHRASFRVVTDTSGPMSALLAYPGEKVAAVMQLLVSGSYSPSADGSDASSYWVWTRWASSSNGKGAFKMLGPFGAFADAEQEFHCVFHAKTGVAWALRDVEPMEDKGCSVFEYDPAHMIPPEELFEPEPAPAPAEPVVRNVGVHRYAPATQHSLSVRPSSDAGLSAHKAIVSAAPYRRAVVSGKGRLPTDDELAQFPRLVKEKWAPEPTKSKKYNKRGPRSGQGAAVQPEGTRNRTHPQYFDGLSVEDDEEAALQAALAESLATAKPLVALTACEEDAVLAVAAQASEALARATFLG